MGSIIIISTNYKKKDRDRRHLQQRRITGVARGGGGSCGYSRLDFLIPPPTLGQRPGWLPRSRWYCLKHASHDEANTGLTRPERWSWSSDGSSSLLPGDRPWYFIYIYIYICVCIQKYRVYTIFIVTNSMVSRGWAKTNTIKISRISSR